LLVPVALAADRLPLPASPNKDPSFIEAAQSYLDQPLFTVDLGHPSNAVMSLGAVDRSRYSGSLTTVQASQCSSGWCLDDITFSVNGVPMGFTQKRMAAGESPLSTVTDMGSNRTLAVQIDCSGYR